MTDVAIIDNGGANIASLRYALERLGADAPVGDGRLGDVVRPEDDHLRVQEIGHLVAVEDPARGHAEVQLRRFLRAEAGRGAQLAHAAEVLLVLGEPGVNVLLLNRALDAGAPTRSR